MSNRNIRRGDTRVFNPDDIVVRERQSGNRQAGNVSGGGYGRNGSGAYGQRVEQTRGQYSGMRDSTESVHRRQAQEESKPEIHFHQNRLKSNRRS